MDMSISRRDARIADVNAKRFIDAFVVLENVDDPHNLGAILRSCDAVGVGEVHLVYPHEKMPRFRELRTKAAASAAKWLRVVRWESADACRHFLHEKGVQILVTALSEKGSPQWSFDLRTPTAIVVGNEHGGISSGWLEQADGVIMIPMRGMVQSLNVSVATAVILQEMMRQRLSSKT